MPIICVFILFQQEGECSHKQTYTQELILEYEHLVMNFILFKRNISLGDSQECFKRNTFLYA